MDFNRVVFEFQCLCAGSRCSAERQECTVDCAVAL
eukprot:SAG11_NODE_28035_length_326_cov_0.682819_1_plen_34_part_01